MRGSAIVIQFANIVVMVLLITSVALQNKSAGLSGVFGGAGNVVSTRRGFEKWLFYATIGLGMAFCGLSIASLIVS